MPNQVSEAVKEARNHDLLRVVDTSARRAGQRLIGQTVQVLCEGPSKTNRARLAGRTRTNKVAIFEGVDDDIGQLIDLRIAHATGFSLSGSKAGESCLCASEAEVQRPLGPNQ